MAERLNAAEQALMDAALVQAEKSFAEGGLPIGAVLGARWRTCGGRA